MSIAARRDPMVAAGSRLHESLMNGLALLSLSVLLLLLPGLFARADRRPGKRPGRPEIHGSLVPMHWMILAYCGLMHRLRTNGWAPLPEHGAAILIANHT